MCGKKKARREVGILFLEEFIVWNPQINELELTAATMVTPTIFSPIRTTFSTALLLFSVANSQHYDTLSDDVINLPTGKFPEPECRYHVRIDDRNGPELKRQVVIGEPIYHHWTCNNGQETALYCILVNNCTVTSSRPRSSPVPIIDEFGCSLFPGVLPHVEYNGDLEGGLKTNAFSLDVDEPAVTFHCNIKLLLKLYGICRRPQCVPIQWYLRKEQSLSLSRNVD